MFGVQLLMQGRGPWSSPGFPTNPPPNPLSLKPILTDHACDPLHPSVRRLPHTLYFIPAVKYSVVRMHGLPLHIGNDASAILLFLATPSLLD